jgi:hypothetical protein
VVDNSAFQESQLAAVKAEVDLTCAPTKSDNARRPFDINLIDSSGSISS